LCGAAVRSAGICASPGSWVLTAELSIGELHKGTRSSLERFFVGVLYVAAATLPTLFNTNTSKRAHCLPENNFSCTAGLDHVVWLLSARLSDVYTTAKCTIDCHTLAHGLLHRCRGKSAVQLLRCAVIVQLRLLPCECETSQRPGSSAGTSEISARLASPAVNNALKSIGFVCAERVL
jgi:hypothetical protein